ncbi:MAG TPA: ATP-binding protein [Cytophagaceae bacterium]|jgi:hypothetical protein|nr:ATP-binding protein [Cytophagaceae bacterium]
MNTIENQYLTDSISAEVSTLNLQLELDWFKSCIKEIVQEDRSFDSLDEITLPDLISENSHYGKFIDDNQFSAEERFVLMLALVPHIASGLLEPLHIKNNPYKLILSKKTESLVPTAETALLLLSSNDLSKKLKYLYLFETDHLFYTRSILSLGESEEGGSVFEKVLYLNHTYIDLFIYNKYRKPRFGSDFPAKYLSTDLSWNDLVLNTNEELKLEEIKKAIKNLYLLKQDRNLGKHVKKGYRVIFYGESGTGKTLTATLIGKEFNKDVFRVDISSVVSKYVGETSKNLEKLFNMAEDKDWILFFDEGDALFGKRTDTNQADNKSTHYANQDIAYLLQRIEDYNGVVIVASNLRDNLDKAFARRFQMAIHFDYPSTENCIKLFQNNNPEICPLDPAINLDKIITENTPVSAANIINSLIRAALICMGVGKSTITSEILSSCFKDEKRKQPLK